MSANDGSLEGTKVFLLAELRDRGVAWTVIDPIALMEVVYMLRECKNMMYQEGVLDLLTFLALNGHLRTP